MSTSGRPNSTAEQTPIINNRPIFAHTVYGKATGMELKTFTKQNRKNKTEEGAIGMRFFGFGEKASLKGLNFQMTPVECFTAARKIDAILAGQKIDNETKFTLTHKFIGKEGEVITSVTFEKWERNGASGFGIAINRGASERIAVGITMDEFAFLSALLKKLSVEQSWQEFVGSGAAVAPVSSGHPAAAPQSSSPAQQPQQAVVGNDYDPFA